MSERDEIEAFFAGYVDAFARWDFDAVAALWMSPGLFMTPAGSLALDADAFRDNGAQLLAFYRAQGVSRPEGELVGCERLHDGVVLTRMRYRLFDMSGAQVVEWEHDYILRRTGEGWRAAFAVADGEIAAWAARGTPMQGTRSAQLAAEGE